MHEPRLPASLRLELAGTRWHWRSGGKHWHLIVNGKLVSIWPRSTTASKGPHYQIHNVRAHIRRAKRNDSR